MELICHLIAQNACTMIFWYAGNSFPLGNREPGFLVPDQRRNLFFLSHHRSSESIKLSYPPALQGTFLFLLPCLKMKTEVFAIENSPSYYNVSAKNYDCKQLEGKSHSGAILAFCKPGYKNKVPLWACLVITLGLRMKTGKKYLKHKHVFFILTYRVIIFHSSNYEGLVFFNVFSKTTW